MSAAVDGNFSATQGLAKVFAQAGAIDQGFSQARHSGSFKHSAKINIHFAIMNRKVVFWPFAKKVESSTAKAYKVLSVWLHYVDSPILLTPGSHCVRRSRRRQWRYERSFSAFECCPKCVITSLGMWSNQAMERIPTLRAFELVILTKWWPWVHRWTDAKFWVNFWGIFQCKRFGCQLSIRHDPMVWTGPCSECVKLRLICWKVWWWTQWGKKITHFDLYKTVKTVGLTHFGRLSMEAVCSHKCHRRTDSAGMDKNRTCESTVSFPKTIQSLTGLTLMKYYARWWFQTFFNFYPPLIWKRPKLTSHLSKWVETTRWLGETYWNTEIAESLQELASFIRSLSGMGLTSASSTGEAWTLSLFLAVLVRQTHTTETWRLSSSKRQWRQCLPKLQIFSVADL